FFSALLAVRIVNDRQQRFGHQRITAGARISVERGRAAVPPKGVNRNDDEGRRSDERDAEHAASGPRRGVAKPHPRHRPRALPLNRPLLVRTQPRRPEEKNRDEQRSSGSEKASDLSDRLRRGGDQQRDSQRAEDENSGHAEEDRRSRIEDRRSPC